MPRIAFLLCCSMLGGAHLFWFLSFPAPTVDFTILFRTAHALASHAPAYYQTDQGGGAIVLHNLNPPHTHALLLPLLALSEPTARAAWQLTTIVAVLGAVHLVQVRVNPGTWVAMFSSATASTLLFSGQLAGICAPLLSIVYRAAAVGAWSTAAVAVGTLAALKPFFAVLALWIAWRARHPWPAMLAGGVCVAIYALGVAWAGIDAYRDWLSVLARITWIGGAWNASWQAWTMRTLPPALELCARIAGWLAIASVTCWRLPRLTLSAQLLAVTCAAFLLSPIAWVHYLAFAVGPIALWLSEGNDWPPLAWLLFTPPLLVILPAPGLSALAWPSCYSYGLLALWFTVSRSRRHQPRGPGQPRVPSGRPGGARLPVDRDRRDQLSTARPSARRHIEQRIAREHHRALTIAEVLIGLRALREDEPVRGTHAPAPQAVRLVELHSAESPARHGQPSGGAASVSACATRTS